MQTNANKHANKSLTNNNMQKMAKLKKIISSTAQWLIQTRLNRGWMVSKIPLPLQVVL